MAARDARLRLGKIKSTILEELLVVGEAAQITRLRQDDQSDDGSDAGNLAQALIIAAVLEERMGSRL